jgi:molybdopterin-guanine dinucleotide biosynthesis protein A
MIGVVLAGGASRRFGGEPKGLKLLRGLPLAMHVARALAQVCGRVLLEDNGDDSYAALGFERIAAAPSHAGKGPLAGIAAGLAAAGTMQVAFAPCDLPMVTPALFKALSVHAAGAYAVSPAGIEPLVCVLPSNVLAVVLEALASPEVPRVVSVMERIGAVAVRFDDAGVFLNVNTPEDLARLNAEG